MHHEFHKDLSRFRVPFVAGIVFHAEGNEVNRTDRNLCPHNNYILVGRETIKKPPKYSGEEDRKIDHIDESISLSKSWNTVPIKAFACGTEAINVHVVCFYSSVINAVSYSSSHLVTHLVIQ